MDFFLKKSVLQYEIYQCYYLTKAVIEECCPQKLGGKLENIV